MFKNMLNIGELAQNEVQTNYCMYLDTFLAHEPSNDIELVNNVIIDCTARGNREGMQYQPTNLQK